MKNVLEKNVLKFHESLHKYLLTCQVNSANLDSFFALVSSNSEGARGISKCFFFYTTFRNHFFPKMVVPRVKILDHLF